MSDRTEVERGTRVVQAGEPRLARVESMRALAALAVVVGHLWVTAHGFVGATVFGTLPRKLVYGLTNGVWVFFGLTGYLLFWPFVRRSFSGGGAIDVRRYAINRAWRILPLYYAAVVGLLAIQVDHPTTELWWRHLLLVQNFWRDTVSRVDAPLWSVVVELQFYALLPLLAIGIGRVARGSRARAALLLVALGVASAVARQVLALDSANPALSLWRFQLPTTFCFFTAGMLLALLRSAWEERPPRWIAGPLGHPALWLAAAVPFWVLVCWHFDLEDLSAPAVFLTIGAVVLPLRPWRALGALDWRPVALLGVASYSLYVWHAPVILELNGGTHLMSSAGFPAVLAAFVPLLLAIAAVSYLVVERPGLRMRRRWAPTSPAPVPSAR